MKRIVDVVALPSYRVRLRYDDGVEGEVDLSHLAGRGVFASWSQPRAFEQVHVTPSGALAWSGDQELCPDALYLRPLVTGRRLSSDPNAFMSRFVGFTILSRWKRRVDQPRAQHPADRVHPPIDVKGRREAEQGGPVLQSLEVGVEPAVAVVDRVIDREAVGAIHGAPGHRRRVDAQAEIEGAARVAEPVRVTPGIAVDAVDVVRCPRWRRTVRAGRAEHDQAVGRPRAPAGDDERGARGGAGGRRLGRRAACEQGQESRQQEHATQGEDPSSVRRARGLYDAPVGVVNGKNGIFMPGSGHGHMTPAA